MDKEINPEPPSLPLKLEDSSSRKNLPGGGDRLKRDEWSEGAVSTLLEAYETKWILRNRAKLKGHDWEDVARCVSNRANSSKSPKTQTQCKNKIESMKKRYRSESASPDASSWPLYPRLDLLLRGSASAGTSAAAVTVAPSLSHPPLILLEPPHVVPHPVPQTVILPLPPPPPPPPPVTLPAVAMAAQNSHGSNGVDRGPKVLCNEEDGFGTKTSDKNAAMETDDHDSSTPAAVYSDKEKPRTKKMKTKMEQKAPKKRRRGDQEWEIADSIRWLAEVVVRSEQARMDTMRELEKMRIDAEARRAEMDLKRTEIMANTQLEIARLFAGVGKTIDSSLRIGRT